ncbi:YcaO-like family protein [Micrococcoides hystricis]|uniref:YcaO-like family protein n=1 Tax=Micrococcoides hystricis TaxID=1572761 RepID=A0ABV6PF13_9MICC
MSTPLLTSPTSFASGFEVRALNSDESVLSRGEKHHRLGLPAETLSLLVTAWSQQRLELISPQLLAAAQGVFELLEKLTHDRLGPQQPHREQRPPALTVRSSIILAGKPELTEPLREFFSESAPIRSLELVSAREVVNQAFATASLLVVVCRGANHDLLVDIDRMCHDMRVNWMPVELTRGRIWAGPVVTPGVGASYEDAAARRLAAAFDPQVHRALRQPAVNGDQGPGLTDMPPITTTLAEVLANASEQVAAYREGDREDPRPDMVHEIWWDDARELTHHELHPVLPLPHRSTQHRDHRPEDLIDPKTGLILKARDVVHDQAVPKSLTTRQADVADIRAVTPWANNVLCQGSAFHDPEGARLAAIGESVERYCGNILDTHPVIFASYDQMLRQGRQAVDPDTLVLYSDRQYSEPGFPFVRLTRELPVHWVPGLRMSDQSEVWVPASLVYVNWYSAGYAASPPTNFCAFAGIAAGPSQDFAVASALEELIERHATMIWWLNAQTLPAVDGVFERTEAGSLHNPAQRVDYLALPNEFGVPVAAAILRDEEEALINIGFSARPSFAQAAAKALTEAYTLQEGSRDLLRYDGLHWQVMTAGELNGRAFKPWREDRRYLDDFRADMRDCDDLMVQQQVYLDPRAATKMSHLLAPNTSVDVHEIGALADRSSTSYLACLHKTGIDPIVVDLTSPDVASTGLHVVRVIAPGLVGNAPAAFPFLGRARVQQAAVELGWRENPLDEEDLNYFPMPHA